MPRHSYGISFDGSRLQEILKEMGVTNAQLAKRLGYTRSAVGKWIKTNKIDPDTLRAICTELQVDPKRLLGEISDVSDIYQEEDGTPVFVDHYELFNLSFDEYIKRTRELLEEKKAQGIPIMSESAVFKQRKRERDHALKCLRELLNSNYIYPSWKHVESEETLSNLLEEIRIYIQTLPAKEKGEKDNA